MFDDFDPSERLPVVPGVSDSRAVAKAFGKKHY
jgi:hypothetical protein